MTIDHTTLKVGFEMTWVWQESEDVPGNQIAWHLSRSIAEGMCRSAILHLALAAKFKVNVPTKTALLRKVPYWDSILDDCNVVTFDPGCVELRTPCTTDLSLHSHLFDFVTARMAEVGWLPHRSHKWYQTGGLDTNVDWPQGINRMIFYSALGWFYNSHPALAWVFAAPWDDYTCKIPVVYTDNWRSCSRPDTNFSAFLGKNTSVNPQCGDSFYTEFRAPMGVDSGEQVWQIGDFHQRLTAFIADECGKYPIRIAADATNDRESLQRIQLDDAWGDFCSVCEMLGLRGQDFDYHYREHLVKRFTEYGTEFRC